MGLSHSLLTSSFIEKEETLYAPSQLSYLVTYNKQGLCLEKWQLLAHVLCELKTKLKIREGLGKRYVRVVYREEGFCEDGGSTVGWWSELQLCHKNIRGRDRGWPCRCSCVLSSFPPPLPALTDQSTNMKRKWNKIGTRPVGHTNEPSVH